MQGWDKMRRWCHSEPRARNPYPGATDSSSAFGLTRNDMIVEAMMNRMNALLCGLASALLLAACGPSAQPGEGTSGGTGQPSAPKKLIWILNLEPEGFSELFGGSSSTHWRMVYEALHDFLVVLDNNGDPVPRLALGLPSRDNGSWQINGDGTME